MIEFAFSLIDKKWNSLIINSLLNGSTKFSDIINSVHGISSKMLSKRLKELETEDIIERKVYPDSPIKIEYTLTEKGKELGIALNEIITWATKWY